VLLCGVDWCHVLHGVKRKSNVILLNYNYLSFFKLGAFYNNDFFGASVSDTHFLKMKVNKEESIK